LKNPNLKRPPAIWRLSDGEVQITDALRLLAQDRLVLAVKFKGQRFDCGSVEGFVEATNYYYEHEHLNKSA
jgi:UTP--glucose-1-phosphate uridylyltransferase